jgi:hypothetical protein
MAVAESVTGTQRSDSAGDQLNCQAGRFQEGDKLPGG